jgi:hypothetical protein
MKETFLCRRAPVPLGVVLSFLLLANAPFKLLVSVLLLLILPAVVQAQFTFTTNNGAITITRYTGPGGVVIVPAETNSYPVTIIAGGAKTSAFGYAGVTSVTIPNSVTNIGAYAFQCCTNLTDITIPDGVISTGDDAFVACSSLTNAALGSNVTSLGVAVFAACSHLVAITVSELNTRYGSTAGVLFNKSQTVLLECPPGKSGTYAIPGGVTNIADSAFSTCASLTDVLIPGSMTTIGNNAFAGCTGLGGITIPYGVMSIGSRAFNNCTSLAGVSLPASLNSIGDYAFNLCTRLADITVPDSVTVIPYTAFGSCSSLAHVTLGNHVTSIGREAFIHCTSLTNFTIPASVTSLDVGVFGGSGLVSIDIPGSITSISYALFSGCTHLTSVRIHNSVTSVGYMAFNFCTSLTNITIPGSVTFIEQEAFRYCTNLKGVYCLGNAPAVSQFDVFNDVNNAIVYYLPGTSGWGPMLSTRPTALWLPRMVTVDGSFGVQTNQFGFNICWASGSTVVVESCTNLASPVWRPLRTNSLVGDSLYFGDTDWTNYPVRLYRIRSP